MVKKLLALFAILIFSFPAFAAEYYALPSGSSGNGTKANPWGPAEISWTTLDDANNTLYLFGGTWSSAFQPAHATTDYTLTIKPCSASPDATDCGTLVTMTGGIVIQGNKIVFNGEKTSGACTGKALNDTTCRWIKLTGNGIGNGYGGTPYVGIKVQYLEITGGSGGSYYGIKLDDYYADPEVSYNYIHDNNSGQSDILVQSTTAAYGGCKIHHNYISNGTTNFLSNPYGCDVYNNYFDSSMMVSPALYDIIHTERGAAYSAQGYHIYERIYNNDFIGCAEQTIFYENGTTGEDNKTEAVRIFNNVFNCYRTESPGVDIKVLSVENYDYATGVNDFFFVNNTVASSGNIGLRLYGHATNPYTNVKIENNIFYNNVTSIGASGGTFPDIAADTDAVLDYNLFYGASGYAFTWINAAHNGTTNYTALSAFETDHGTLTNNVENDNPDFVSASDFQLQAGSPAIDTGADLSALTNMPTGWPFDKNGVTRTGSWDIGAYEYNGAADTAPPTITSATINAAGDALTIAFPEIVNMNTSTGFTLNMSGGAAGLSYASGSGTNSWLYNITGRNIDTAETGTLDYVTVANGIEDASGNDLASTGESDITVTNDSTYSPSATTYIVTVQSSGNCTVSPLTNQVIVSGETASYTCTTNGNSGCAAWTGTCGGTGTTSFTSSAVTGNCTVIQGCYKISPDIVIGAGSAVTLGTGAVGTLY